MTLGIQALGTPTLDMGFQPDGVEKTFLTERQAEILALRNQGLTQREIADKIGTTVANVSTIERAARQNIASAKQTLELAAVLESAVWFTVEAGTDFRTLIDRIYRRGDAANVKLAYTEPELSTHLHENLRDNLEGRQLTADARIGITTDGTVVTYPTTEPDVE